ARLDTDNFAGALEIDIAADGNGTQAVGRQLSVRSSHDVPYRRILGTESPKRVARRLIRIGRVDLVVGGHAGEEPDIMTDLAVFGVGEGRIVGRVVVGYGRFGIARSDDRFLEREAVRLVAVPVISEGAEP